MDYPRFPDWLIYFAASGAILVAAVSRQEHADSPEAPPPPPGAERVPLGPSSPFDPVSVIRTGVHKGHARGTAFAVVDGGLWLTARSQVAGCDRVALKVAEGRAVTAQVQPGGDPQLAVLKTDGGPPGLPLSPAAGPGRNGARAFLVGFPRQAPGEASAMLMTTGLMKSGFRGQPPAPVRVWAETGRTENMKGALSGLVGAPVIGADHQVQGVVLRQDQDRARFYAAAPEAIARILADAGARPQPAVPAEPISVSNYGLAADGLRRSGQVAQVLCLLR